MDFLLFVVSPENRTERRMMILTTCYESHMRFPTDMKLLWESIE